VTGSDEEEQMSALRLISVLGLGVGLTLTACGDDDSDAGSATADGGAEQRISVESSDALKFEPDHLDATAGVIHIVHDNSGSTVHTFVLDGQDFKLTDDDEGDIDLAAGDYVFYCDVPGHRAAGMEGTLTVSP
jgi:plastocyanin